MVLQGSPEVDRRDQTRVSEILDRAEALSRELQITVSELVDILREYKEKQ
jgi:beta-mannanase